MLVGPGGGASIRPHYFKNRVHANPFVRINRIAIVLRIAREEVGVDSAASIEFRQVGVDGLVIPDGSAPNVGAQAGAAGGGKRWGQRGWRECAIVCDVVPETCGPWRTPGDECGQTRKGIGRSRSGGVRVGDAALAQEGERGILVRGNVVR